MKGFRILLVALLLLLTTSAYAVDSSQYLYERTAEIVGGSNIKGFWVFDATGTAVTVTDRSANSHTMDLGGAASTLSPSVYANCPNLTMAGTAATSFSVGDDADFTPSATGFTVMMLANPTTMVFLAVAKQDAGANWEWLLGDVTGDFYFIIFGASDWSKYKWVTAPYPTDTGSWHTYAGTASGNTNAATLKLYRDGALWADTPAGAGAFTVPNTASDILDTYNGALINSSEAKFGVVIIISRELTSTEVGEVNTLLQSYVGTGIPPMDLLIQENN